MSTVLIVDLQILSIQKALPLQIHPDKELAAELHKKDPEKYTDDNHKPEIAVALSKFETFVGWKPLSDIETLFHDVEPLKKYLPADSKKFDNETLKTVCRNILAASDKDIAETQQQLGSLEMKSLGKQSYILDLLPRLQQQYSKEDPGGCPILWQAYGLALGSANGLRSGNLIALLLMNFLVLSPGDAIFVPADGIHAYLSGDIVECMARSNNVINTGFCPRASRDSVELFTNALTFSSHSADEAMLPSKTSKRGRHGRTKEYAPPMSEFNMLVTQLEAKQQEVVEPVQGPSIMIVTSGSGTMKVEGKTHDLKEGYVFFTGQGVAVEFESEKGMVAYRAYAEV